MRHLQRQHVVFFRSPRCARNRSRSLLRCAPAVRQIRAAANVSPQVSHLDVHVIGHVCVALVRDVMRASMIKRRVCVTCLASRVLVEHCVATGLLVPLINYSNNRTLPYIGVFTVVPRRGAVRCRSCWQGSLRPQRQQLLRLAGMCRAARAARGARHRTVPLRVRAVVRLPGAVASVVRCSYCVAPCALIQPLCNLFAGTHCASSLLLV